MTRQRSSGSATDAHATAASADVRHRLVSIATEMITLLDGANTADWRRTFEAIVRRLNAGDDLRDVGRVIKAMFAGMGSLTDLVIYRQGQVAAENGRFHELQHLLYAHAVDSICFTPSEAREEDGT